MEWLIVFALFLLALLVQDIVQRKDAVRRNLPLLGRLRKLADHAGVYYRRYLSAGDREEFPFNRSTRQWIGRVSSGVDDKIGFGSTRPIAEPGSVLFVNAPYALLVEEASPAEPVIIGARCDKPFVPGRIFNISAMGHAMISRSAIQALAKGSALSGIWLNTGENGATQDHFDSGCDLVFQIGKAKYEDTGVRDRDGRLSDDRLREVSAGVRAFEIKLSQGAKPGRGRVLLPESGEIRYGSRHREIRSHGDLLDMVARIRDVTGRPVGFKAAISSRAFLEGLCHEIHKRGTDSAPDFITVDGGEGGSGQTQQTFAESVGLSLTESLPFVIDVLMEQGLRERISVIASGKLVTSEKVAWALCMGADYIVSARGFMFSLGCIQTLNCHKGTCPAGIATHSKYLQRGLDVGDKSRAVAYYANWINSEIDAIARACGLQNARQLRREHARIVQPDGSSAAMDRLFPYPTALTGES